MTKVPVKAVKSSFPAQRVPPSHPPPPLPLLSPTPASGGVGGGAERVRLAGEAWRDQEDDGNGSQGHREAGGQRGDGGHREAEAALRRGDPPPPYRAGPPGLRPGEEDLVHLRAPGCPAGQPGRRLGHCAFHPGGERW